MGHADSAMVFSKIGLGIIDFSFLLAVREGTCLAQFQFINSGFVHILSIFVKDRSVKDLNRIMVLDISYFQLIVVIQATKSDFTAREDEEPFP